MKFNQCKLLLLIGLIVIVFCGCASPNRLSEPVGKFQKATTGTIEVAQPYFIQLNRVERRLKFTGALADHKKKLDPSFLAPTFSPKGIQARIECLTLVNLYATRLGEIADSKASETLGTNADALGTSLTNLGTSIEKITGDSAKIHELAGPVSALAKLVGQMWIENERKRALELAIRQGAPAVNRVLDLMELDLREAYRGKLEALVLGYSQLALDYERNKGTMTYPERKALLNDLESLANEYDELASVSTPPQELIGKMRMANNAMVTAAENLDNVQSWKDFAAATEVFAQRVQQAQAVLKGLRQNP